MRLLYFALLLVASSGAGTQSLPAAGSSPVSTGIALPSVPNGFTRADTARAIRKLFRSRRGGGVGWLSFGAAGILGSTLPALQTTSAGVWTPGVVAASALMLIGVNKRIQFRLGRERRVLRELAATGHLPHSVARRLRGRFGPVQGSPAEYDPLSAPGIRLRSAELALTPAQLAEVAHADTLRAINRLFVRRRRGSKTWSYLGLSGALALVRILTSPSNNTMSADGNGLAILAGVFIVAPVAIGIVNLTAYSETHQQELEDSYRFGKPLPSNIRQRIKTKNLQPYD